MAWLVPGLDDPAGLGQSVDQLAKADIAGMARAAGSANIYIDKTSPHIIMAGLLSKIHPGAKFVLPNRDPRDMAVSMFFHDFTAEFKYTRSIQGISDYLKLQDKAAQAWRDAGLSIVDYDHDAFVAEPEVKSKALFEALDLPWSEAVLQAQSSDAAVRTFSARQVRDGVSKKFQGRGERYATFLEAAGF